MKESKLEPAPGQGKFFNYLETGETKKSATRNAFQTPPGRLHKLRKSLTNVEYVVRSIHGIGDRGTRSVDSEVVKQRRHDILVVNRTINGLTRKAVRGSYDLALVLDKLQDPQGAVRLLQRAVQINPDFANAHLYMASLMARFKKHDVAIRHFREVLRIQRAYNDLGSFYVQEGNLDEAIENFHKAIELDPDFARARNNLRRALDMQASR